MFKKSLIAMFIALFVVSPLNTTVLAQVVGENLLAEADAQPEETTEEVVETEETVTEDEVVTEETTVVEEKSEETTEEVVETEETVTEEESSSELIDSAVSDLFGSLLNSNATTNEQEEPTKSTTTFVETVELGVTYAHVNNEQVKVTFTKLPENPGSVTIEEVILTDEQVKQFGAVSNIAYDITSSMENGTFEYDLKLPAPKSKKGIVSKVSYAETVEDLDEGKTTVVEDTKVQSGIFEDTVEVNNMNHFTIFVVVRTSQDFAGLTWTADRSTPSGGWTESVTELEMTILASGKSTVSSFYYTEGVQADIPAGNNSVKATLHIDGAWNGVDYVRAGLWGKVARVINPANNDTSWPIMEFANDGANPRVRVWDTIVGGWTDVAVVAYGDTVTFEVLQNPHTDTFEFYLDGTLVDSYSSVDTPDNYEFYDGLILNAYNNGGSDYEVTWSNLEIGSVEIHAETTDSAFLSSEKFVRVNNASDLAAQIRVPEEAVSVLFDFAGVGVASVADVVGVEHIQPGQWPKANGDRQFRVKTALPAGEYDVTAEFLLDGNWFSVTGTAKVYSVENPATSIVYPNDTNYIFRPSDANIVRLRIDDGFNSFKRAEFKIGGTTYGVTRNTPGVDLRQAGNYVLVDMTKAPNWVPLPEGNYVATVNAWNNANGRAFTSHVPTREFIIDATKPVVSEFAAPDLVAAVANDSTFTTSAKATDVNGIDSVKFYLAELPGNGIPKNNLPSIMDVYGVEGANGVYTAEFDVSGLDGEYVILVSAKDTSAHNSTPLFRKITIDGTAPTIPTITKPSVNQWFKTTPILNEWTAATDASDVTYQVAYAFDDEHTFGGSACSDVSEIEGKSVGGCRDTTATSRNHTPSVSAQGGVTIFVRAIDEAGNKSDWSEGVNYHYDKDAPVTDITVSSVVNGTFTVSGTATDNLALNRVYVQLVNRQTNSRVGGTTIHLIGTGTSSPWMKEYTGLSDGEYAAHVSVTDMAGNTGSAGWTENFTVITAENNGGNEGGGNSEEVVPTGNIVAPTLNQVVSGTLALFAEYFDGDAEDDDTVAWAVRAGTCAVNDEVQVAGNVAGFDDNFTFDGQNFSANFDTTSVENGSYCFIFNPIDDGDTDVRETATFTVDNTTEIEVEEPPVVITPASEPVFRTQAGGSTGGGDSDSDGGQVLGAATGLDENTFCSTNSLFLSSFIENGGINDAGDVALLQVFLNAEGYELTVDGIYTSATVAAVNLFQLLHKEEILAPWVPFGFDINSPSGNVFKTTRWKINNMVCPGSEAFPLLP